MSTLLKTEHLKKYYGKKKIVKAVDDVSLEIHAGSSMALIGESGSGKTTFGKLIAGLEKPTDGKFWFQGQEMQDLSEKQFRPYRKNLQMVFQSSSGVFDPGYTIGENILEILKLHEKLQEGEYEERVKEALIQTGLDPGIRNRYVGQISGGQCQRANIARALVLRPELVICDEPVSSLDYSIRKQILHLLNELQEKYDMTYLLITHDHWDHLDYPTVKMLESRVGKVICGLGVGFHLLEWGYPADKIVEADWFTRLKNPEGVDIHVLPARHFSGRGLVRNRTLWVSYALVSPKRRIFVSGDTGYGPHLKQIGETLGRFDLAILENGQYDKRWAYIHMMPEETAQAAVEIGAKALLPAHSGKFAISNHAWKDPFIRLARASYDKPYKLLTPVIGEPVYLEDEKQIFSHWWEKCE